MGTVGWWVDAEVHLITDTLTNIQSLLSETPTMLSCWVCFARQCLGLELAFLN